MEGQRSIHHDFYEAIRTNNEELFDTLILQIDVTDFPDIDIDGKMCSPLVVAIIHKNDSIAAKLIRHGFPFNFPIELPSKTVSLFTVAIWENMSETFTEMINHGQDLNSDTDCGLSSLVHAIARRNEEFAMTLIEKGCDLNQAPTPGAHALLVAILKNLQNVSIKLIEQGCDLDVVSCGAHVLMTAIHKSQTNVALKMIERGCDINYTSSCGATTIDWSLHLNISSSDVSKKLMQMGCHLSAKNKNDPFVKNFLEEHTNEARTAFELFKSNTNIYPNFPQDLMCFLFRTDVTLMLTRKRKASDDAHLAPAKKQKTS